MDYARVGTAPPLASTFRGRDCGFVFGGGDSCHVKLTNTPSPIDSSRLPPESVSCPRDTGVRLRHPGESPDGSRCQALTRTVARAAVRGDRRSRRALVASGKGLGHHRPRRALPGRGVPAATGGRCAGAHGAGTPPSPVSPLRRAGACGPPATRSHARGDGGAPPAPPSGAAPPASPRSHHFPCWRHGAKGRRALLWACARANAPELLRPAPGGWGHSSQGAG